MERNQIYLILKMRYGALAQVAKECGVTTVTVRNILKNSTPSEWTDLVLSVSKNIAEKILLSLKEEAEEQIAQLTSEISKYADLREKLAA